MQVLGGAAYIYDVTNFGLGVGFFANSNHQGNFLLVCLILLGAVVADTPSTRRRDTRFASRVMGGAAGLVLVVGVLLSGSLACYLFLAPVLIAVFLMQRPDVVFARWQVALACALAVAGVVGVLFYGSDNDLVKKGAIEGLSRGEFLANGLVMLRDFAPFDSGLGTFVQLYPSYEAAETVGNTFVNHAHNDWLELLIETGVIGAAAVGLFLLWFVRCHGGLEHRADQSFPLRRNGDRGAGAGPQPRRLSTSHGRSVRPCWRSVVPSWWRRVSPALARADQRSRAARRLTNHSAVFVFNNGVPAGGRLCQGDAKDTGTTDD